MNTVPQTTEVQESLRRRSPIQAFAADEYDEDRRLGTKTVQSAELHESVRHLMNAGGHFDIRDEFVVPQLLPEGDSHWIDQDEIRREKPDAMGEHFAVVRVYDLKTGEKLFDGTRAPEGWWPEQMGWWYDRLTWFARTMPNTYVVNGDYLFVSGGAWVIAGMPNDGSNEVEFTSWSSINGESKAEADRERAEWLAEHAEAVTKVQPAWADPDLTWVDLLRIDDEDDIDPDLIEFRRNVGGVAIEQSCHVDDGVLTLQGEPQIRVTEVTDDHGVFAVDHAPQVGADLIVAASLVSGELALSVEVVAVVAAALGASPVDMFAVREWNGSRLDGLTLGELCTLARDAGVSPAEYLKANS